MGSLCISQICTSNINYIKKFSNISSVSYWNFHESRIPSTFNDCKNILSLCNNSEIVCENYLVSLTPFQGVATTSNIYYFSVCSKSTRRKPSTSKKTISINFLAVYVTLNHFLTGEPRCFHEFRGNSTHFHQSLWCDS